MNIKVTTIIKDMMEITGRGNKVEEVSNITKREGGCTTYQGQTNNECHRTSRHHGHSSRQGYYVWYIEVIQEIQRFKY